MKEAAELAFWLNAEVIDDMFIVQFFDARKIFYQWDKVNSLLSIVGKWKGFEAYYRGFICGNYKDYKTLFYNIQDIKNCYQNMVMGYSNPEMCCKTARFGCYRVESEYKDWYNYGSTRDYKKWDINKEELLNDIRDCIHRKNVDACPLFDMNTVKRKVDKLPNYIVLNKDWEPLYKLDIENGVFVKKAVSISPLMPMFKIYTQDDVKSVLFSEIVNNKYLTFEDKLEMAANILKKEVEENPINN